MAITTKRYKSALCLILMASFLMIGPNETVQGNGLTINSGTIDKVNDVVDGQAKSSLLLPMSLIRQQAYIFPAISTKTDDQKDSDMDGIPNLLDSHPYNAGAMSNAKYNVNYKNKVYVFRLNIPPDYVDVYRQRAPHALKESGDNIADFIIHDEPFIKDLVEQAVGFGKEDETVRADELLLMFAKSIDYNADAYTGKLEYPKYPIETLMDHSGDCEDLAILAVNLLAQLKGSDEVAFIWFPQHMGIGLKVSGRFLADLKKMNMPSASFENDGNVYLYQEVTNPAWKPGQLPEIYKDQGVRVFPVI